MSLLMPKVNLKLNLNVLVMLNVSGVRDMDIMLRDNGDVESESDSSDCQGMPPLEDSDGDELALPVEESLVIRRTLQVQVKEDDINEQRENIFHTRCYVQSKVCGLIIDSGSCVNVCA